MTTETLLFLRRLWAACLEFEEEDACGRTEDANRAYSKLVGIIREQSPSYHRARDASKKAGILQ